MKDCGGKWRNFTADACRHFLEKLRQARLAAQKDAEQFNQLLFVFEQMGAFLLPNGESLGNYKAPLLAFAANSALGGEFDACHSAWHSDSRVLYELVNHARNDALHQGARARHLTEHCIELALLFEDALMNGDKPMVTLGDIMVRLPQTAETWQPVSFIRQIMLANSYSFLPVFSNDCWKVISDAALAAFLRKDLPHGNAREQRDDRKRRLGLSLEEASLKGLAFEDVHTKSEETPIAEIAQQLDHRPILVCREDKVAKKLLGIVTAFDIL